MINGLGYDAEAVLRLIRLTADNARKQGIRVGICGEMAADPAMTSRFLDMGVNELSVPPSSILSLRAHIAGL